MAVYKRSYRPYAGALTAPRGRFLVVARFALLGLLESRVLLMFLIGSFVPFLIESGAVYLANNPTAALLLNASGPRTGGWIDEAFFLRCLGLQGFIAFALATWIGPGLVAPDLANGALPLYLSRPLSRAEYVLGKMTVLVGLLSLVTWVPLLLLFLLQASLAPDWLGAHWRIGGGLLVGSAIWTFVLALLALALSAWVRWRLAASVLMCGIFFVGSAMGEAWRSIMGNSWGRLLDLSHAIGTVWGDLLGRPLRPETPDLPVWAAWASLLTVCVVSLWLLDRRVRAKEIVR